MGAPLRLWGDGIHDDAPALQAILDGRGAMVAGAEGMYWPGFLRLRRGVYLVKNTLTVPTGYTLDGGASKGGTKCLMPHDEPLLTVPGSAQNVTIQNMWMERLEPHTGIGLQMSDYITAYKAG